MLVSVHSFSGYSLSLEGVTLVWFIFSPRNANPAPYRSQMWAPELAYQETLAVLTAYRHLLPDSVALSQFIVHLGLVLLLGICILLTLACRDRLLLD